MKDILHERAKTLRYFQTDAELKLWYNISYRQILNCEFRRQYVLGNYIVDFICLEKYLIIEVDGGHHLNEVAYDQIRTDYLNKLGFKVLRFWNSDVIENTEGVLEVIYQTLAELP